MVFLPIVSEEYSKLQKQADKFSRALRNLESSTWFLECSPWVSWENGNKAAALKLRALDARLVARRFWSNKAMVLIMSATIGDSAPLADKLGIDPETMEHHVYEHPIPIAYRPIYNLHCQRMTYTNLKKFPNLYRIQGAQIAAFIKGLPPEWRGIVMTSSYTKIRNLSKVLVELLPNRRIITQQAGMKIDELTQQFIGHGRLPGDVLICSIQGFGEGLDLRGDLARFAVVAGVPFDNPTDPYIQAMKGQAGGQKYLLAKTYAAIPQACGRVTRATKEKNGEWRLNVAAIADGSAMTGVAKKYYPEFFKSALEQTNGQN
jgi:Rad3-related DNA helicase